jgi:hypothetical protein
VVYRPALVIFVVARLLLDLYSSMLSEVSKYNLELPATSRKSAANSFCKVYWLLVSAIFLGNHAFIYNSRVFKSRRKRLGIRTDSTGDNAGSSVDDDN